MSITTLILSFYLNKAYALWRDIYVLGRKVQGRINDVSMMLGEYILSYLFTRYEYVNTD